MFAAERRRVNWRPEEGGRHFVVMSERRRGVREYSDDRARRTIFLVVAVWDWNWVVSGSAEAVEVMDSLEEEEEGGERDWRRRVGGGEGSGEACWRIVSGGNLKREDWSLQLVVCGLCRAWLCGWWVQMVFFF